MKPIYHSNHQSCHSINKFFLFIRYKQSYFENILMPTPQNFPEMSMIPLKLSVKKNEVSFDFLLYSVRYLQILRQLI